MGPLYQAPLLENIVKHRYSHLELLFNHPIVRNIFLVRVDMSTLYERYFYLQILLRHIF